MFGNTDIRELSLHKCHTKRNDYREASPNGCSLHISYISSRFPNIIPFQLLLNLIAVLSIGKKNEHIFDVINEKCLIKIKNIETKLKISKENFELKNKIQRDNQTQQINKIVQSNVPAMFLISV